jgi:hypothetical protein
MFTSVDPQLQQYFDYFYNITGLQTSGITAGFTTLGTDIAGECVWGGLWNEVRINSTPGYWNAMPPNVRQQLVSHELGHCALYLHHINNCSNGQNLPDGSFTTCNGDGSGTTMPLSIMNWYLFTSTQANNLTASPYQYYQYLKLNAPIP